MTSSERFAHRSVSARFLVAFAVAIALCLPARPVGAAQGSPPTTDLTGYVDTQSQPLPATFSQGCFPAGGQTIADPDVPAGDVVFVGGGWGHGAGMSQFGAQGAGRLGCTAEQILTTYFPGTATGAVDPIEKIVIGLNSTVTSMILTAEAAPVSWELCHYQTGECEELDATQGTRETWTVRIQPDASYTVTGGDETVVFEGGDFEHNLRARLSADDGDNRRMAVNSTGHSYRWGTLQIDSVQAAQATGYLTLEIDDIDLYLRGLAEVPASWPAATLQAQAISGRSYAVGRMQATGIRDSCRCHLLATPADQNYEGYDYELADERVGGNWRNAVEASSGRVLRYQGAVADTFYSSSHGGHSESARFVFGNEVPYVQPVEDSRWDLASGNARRRWTKSVTAEELGSAAGVGVATGIELLEPRGAAGRVGHPSRGYGGVQVTGTTGQVVLTGDDVRRALGLFSTLFDVQDNLVQASEPPTDPSEPPESSEPPPGPGPADLPSPDSLVRAAGASRIDTAVQVSRIAWENAPDVVLSAADRFPDALAGVKLAATLEAPLLLTPGEGLPSAVTDELRRLGTQTVWVLGGTAAVSSDVRGDLSELGINTRRLSGADRYETAAAIAVASTTSAEEVTVALGTDWPDAVSASSLAALVDGPPTLLVERDQVPAATIRALRDLGTRRVTVVGGTAVISDGVVAQFEALGTSVTRVSGPDRFATSAAVGDRALAARSGNAPLIVASGGGFPDALAAGALAGRVSGVLVLAPTRQLADGPATRDFVDRNADRFQGGIVVGGTGVISAEVAQEIESRIAG